MKNDLRDLHLFDWSDEDREALTTIIQNYFKSQHPHIEILDIIAAGSRVALHEHPVFKETSDLDTAILIDDKIFKQVFGRELLFSTYDDNYAPAKLDRLYYKQVPISIFIRAHNGSKNKYFKYVMDYYSLVNNILYKGNLVHEVDYYIHIKPRIPKYTFCYLCEKFKEAPNRIEIKSIRKEENNVNYNDSLLHDYRGYIYMCDNCMSKIGLTVTDIRKTLQSKIIK